ncbi:uncharacterized mitochondrial protein AtMg00820-like [Vigna angularis]|uniref:uncharacterized mitochondrial protein AtMg00820-like n=1 Tax=Phaseolus angularis TaxID=3914 RepID=UPI00080A3C46|nr:uncharacterized mitochondrial protein AtMg00820-like [Vigna angularis]
MGDFVSGEGLSEEEEVVQNITGDHPILFEEVVQHAKWREAMDSEIQSIEKNQTWELMDLPARAKIIGVKWVYKTKLNELGEVDKYKAMLVAKGYSQQHGIDLISLKYLLMLHAWTRGDKLWLWQHVKGGTSFNQMSNLHSCMKC